MQINSSRKINIYRFFVAVFFFFCVFFPQSYAMIRFSAFIGIIIFSRAQWHVELNQSTKSFLAFCTINILFLCYGCLRSNKAFALFGATKSDIIYPVMFFLAFWGWSRKDREFIQKLLLFYGTILCVVHTIWLAMARAGIQQPEVIAQFQDASSFQVGIYEGMGQYISKAQQSLVFLIPYIIVMAVVNRESFGLLFALCGTACALFCFFSAGRVALFVSATIGIVFSLFFRFRRKVNLKKFFTVILLLFVLLTIISGLFQIYDFRMSVIIDYIKNKVADSKDFSSSQWIRAYQRYSLLSGWESSPIVGWGSGAFSKNMGGLDWSKRGYEYIYYLLLFRKGIIGALAYIIFYGRVLLKLCKLRNRSLGDYKMYTPVLAGFISAIIAGGTNPYLCTSGAMWMLFVPFAMVASTELEDKGNIANGSIGEIINESKRAVGISSASGLQ